MAKDWIVAILFSAGCGALVGTGVGAALGYPPLAAMLGSAAAGIGIGIVAKLLSELVYRTVGTSPLPAFAVVFLVIGAGTLAFSLLFGVREVGWIVAMAASAELIGLGFSFGVYRYSLRLNRKLKETQRARAEEEGRSS